MEASELFLWMWAVVATMLAVYFNHHARMREKVLVITMLAFRDVADGKAEVYMDDGQLRIREKKDATTN